MPSHAHRWVPTTTVHSHVAGFRCSRPADIDGVSGRARGGGRGGGARAHPHGLVRAVVQECAAAAAAAPLGAASRRGRPKLFLLLWRQPHIQPVFLQVTLHLQGPPTTCLSLTITNLSIFAPSIPLPSTLQLLQVGGDMRYCACIWL